MERHRVWYPALPGIALLIGCSTAPVGPGAQLDDGKSYWPAAAWRTASPSAAGFDPTRLENLLSRIRSKKYAEVHGLVIVKNGYVITEEYFNGSSALEVHEMQSVTKSVTSLVMGIAIDQKRFRTTDKLLGFFPEYTDIRNLDDRKRAVTLADALSMRSGIDFYEDPYPGSPLDQLNSSRGDWLRIVLDEPMNAAPGELWQYNSGVVISLGGVIFNSTHINADDFARQGLFVVPKYDLVVAVTSGGTTFNGYIDPVNFLYSEILPALSGREPLRVELLPGCQLSELCYRLTRHVHQLVALGADADENVGERDTHSVRLDGTNLKSCRNRLPAAVAISG